MSAQTEMARAERADLLDFLRTLTAAQWDSPTLCAGWNVKDVVAHILSYEELGIAGLFRRFVKGSVVHANQIGVDEYSSLSPDELVHFLSTHLHPRGLTAAFGGMIALVDGTIHHQDIRRALHSPRHIPAERLLRVLDLTRRNPRLGVPRRIRGLTLRADDVEWTTGRGPEVRGPGEALLMAMAGRPAALHDLTGPGEHVLAGRLGA